MTDQMILCDRIWKNMTNHVGNYIKWQEMIQYPVDIEKKWKCGEIGKTF